jgi:hypothetical protein
MRIEHVQHGFLIRGDETLRSNGLEREPFAEPGSPLPSSHRSLHRPVFMPPVA